MNDDERDRTAEKEPVVECWPDNRVKGIDERPPSTSEIYYLIEQPNQRGLDQSFSDTLGTNGPPLPAWVPDPDELENWWGWKR